MAVDAIAVRVENLDRRVDNLEGELREHRPAVIAAEAANLREDVHDLRAAVSSLQSTILRSTITLCVALAGTSATIWAVFR